ncbi:MAG: hypothetical protein ACFFEU_00470 [Candidatus Thorarchaeota archaeon]
MTELQEEARESQSHTAIEIHGLSRVFGNFYAVKGFDFQVPNNSVPQLCPETILGHDLTIETRKRWFRRYKIG